MVLAPFRTPVLRFDFGTEAVHELAGLLLIQLYGVILQTDGAPVFLGNQMIDPMSHLFPRWQALMTWVTGSRFD